MGYRKRVELPQKLELTSIIDIVFLLLIYFLVTSMLFPILTGGETSKGEEYVGVPNMETDRISETAAFIVVYPFSGDWDSPSADYGYYFFDESTDRNVFQDQLNNLNDPVLIAQFRPFFQIGPTGFGFEHTPRQLTSAVQGKTTVTIKAPAGVPLNRVMRVYDLCRKVNPAVKVTLLIHPGRQGIFDNLGFTEGTPRHVRIYG